MSRSASYLSIVMYVHYKSAQKIFFLSYFSPPVCQEAWMLQWEREEGVSQLVSGSCCVLLVLF